MQSFEQIGAALSSYEDDEPYDGYTDECDCRRRSCDVCNPDGFDRDPRD